MGRIFIEGINGKLIYLCLCGNGLTSEEELISSNFRGIYGAAALFQIVKNVSTGRAEPREMLTGRHIVRSINCLNCGNYVGWYYEFANERSQQGKEGKYVLELEKCKVKRGVCRYSTV